MKEREPLDIEMPKKKNPGDPKPGEIRNPDGRTKGAVSGSTKMGSKARATLLQKYVRSPAPHIIYGMLSARAPEAFIPQAILRKLKAKTELEDDEDKELKHLNLSLFKWVNELLVKMMGKQIGDAATDVEGTTLAARTKRATVETKSAKVIDMVRRKKDTDLYEAEEE